MTAQSGAADEQRTTNDEKHSGPCPDCGGRTYYEPNISHGTRHEATSGWACLSCPWTKLDPTSGESRLRAARTANRVNTLENATCGECCNDEFEATYQKQPSADPASNFVAVPVIACTECGAVVVREPGPDVFEVFDK